MAQFVKSFVVFANFQMRQFMDCNHLQKAMGVSLNKAATLMSRLALSLLP